jgi:hypothetical protein
MLCFYWRSIRKLKQFKIKNTKNEQEKGLKQKN